VVTGLCPRLGLWAFPALMPLSVSLIMIVLMIVGSLLRIGEQ
jgi:hypothetical protein